MYLILYLTFTPFYHFSVIFRNNFIVFTMQANPYIRFEPSRKFHLGDNCKCFGRGFGDICLGSRDRNLQKVRSRKSNVQSRLQPCPRWPEIWISRLKVIELFFIFWRSHLFHSTDANLIYFLSLSIIFGVFWVKWRRYIFDHNVKYLQYWTYKIVFNFLKKNCHNNTQYYFKL